MKNFKEFINEGNELQQRVNKHITKGVSIGAVSPERGSHTPKQKEEGHRQIKKDLEAARKAGHIGGWTGPHKGQYQYGGDTEVSHEGSYVVHASGAGPEHHERMLKAISDIGNKHGQESVLAVNAANKNAKWHYLDSSDNPGSSESQGTMVYNRKLTKGTGRTLLKRGKHSFTSE